MRKPLVQLTVLKNNFGFVGLKPGLHTWYYGGSIRPWIAWPDEKIGFSYRIPQYYVSNFICRDHEMGHFLKENRCERGSNMSACRWRLKSTLFSIDGQTLATSLAFLIYFSSFLLYSLNMQK